MDWFVLWVCFIFGYVERIAFSWFSSAQLSCIWTHSSPPSMWAPGCASRLQVPCQPEGGEDKQLNTNHQHIIITIVVIVSVSHHHHHRPSPSTINLSTINHHHHHHHQSITSVDLSATTAWWSTEASPLLRLFRTQTQRMSHSIYPTRSTVCHTHKHTHTPI